MMINDFNQLKAEALGCTKCQLCQTRTNVVFGTGNPNAEVMFIGEGPGKSEDEQGLPFVGRSGQLLDKMLAAVDLYRDKNIYIANMVKCRPPENRDPKPEEIEMCIGYLRNQVHIIKPKIIVCLGRVAATSIIAGDFKVTKQHGEFYNSKGVLLMGTYHPALLLRSPSNKPAALQDFINLREKIKEVCVSTYQ